MSQTDTEKNFFDRARIIAATGMFTAGVCAVVGAILDWVSITPPPRVPEDQADRVKAFTGLEVTDGKVVLVAGIVLIVAAASLLVKHKSAILGILAAILLGGIAFADFRQVSEPTSDMMRRMDRVGVDGPGIGLVLVAIAAVLGLITSVAGMAASPTRADD